MESRPSAARCERDQCTGYSASDGRASTPSVGGRRLLRLKGCGAEWDDVQMHRTPTHLMTHNHTCAGRRMPRRVIPGCAAARHGAGCMGVCVGGPVCSPHAMRCAVWHTLSHVACVARCLLDDGAEINGGKHVAGIDCSPFTGLGSHVRQRGACGPDRATNAHGPAWARRGPSPTSAPGLSPPLPHLRRDWQQIIPPELAAAAHARRASKTKSTRASAR